MLVTLLMTVMALPVVVVLLLLLLRLRVLVAKNDDHGQRSAEERAHALEARHG